MDTLYSMDQAGNVIQVYFISLSLSSCLDRRMAAACFPPTLLVIRDSVLEANFKLGSDLEVNGWHTSKAKRM